jgi:glycosyltransferase involved in cell wall biosynthesis
MTDSLRVVMADFHHGWGGQAAYVLSLARGLRSAGHELTIACPAGSDLAARSAEAGLEVFTACAFQRGFRPLSFWKDIRELGRFLRKADSQILHTHGSQDCWRAALSSRPADCRHLRTKHNSYPVARHPANKWLYRHGIDRLIVVAGALKPLLTGILPPESIAVLHAPVAETFFSPPGGEAFRQELGVDAETPLIGVVARLVPDKGQEQLLRALTRIRAQFPRARAVFAGDGSEYDRLLALAAELDLAEAAHFLGPRADVPEITAALDVAVLPSTGCDASSTVVKEALASGTPVVATDVGGIREIVEDGTTGWIVPPGQPRELAAAIIAVLADPQAAAESAARGREVMRRRFSLDKLVEEQSAIYRATLKENRT